MLITLEPELTCHGFVFAGVPVAESNAVSPTQRSTFVVSLLGPVITGEDDTVNNIVAVQLLTGSVYLIVAVPAETGFI